MSAAPDPIPTPYDVLGGEAGLRRLVDAFYDAMDTNPAAATLRAMHGADLAPMRARLADWLSGWTGGPPVYFERHPGRGCLMSAHRAFPIGADEVSQWLACMHAAMDQVEVPALWRKALEQAFARMCAGMQNV